jgi:hypothetical protein
MLPRARSGGLVVEHVEGELVVYDRERHRAHCLNASAARLWRACDGRRDVKALAAALGLSPPVVAHGLRQLSDAHLLEAAVRPRVLWSRRHFVRRFGVALVPAVVTVLAPRAAQAASCVGLGGVCKKRQDCCPGLVCTGLGHKTCNPAV